MCGIFGIIGRQDRELLRKMDNALFHRGPDSSGAIHLDNASIGVRRLSIIDLETGDQPITNEDKTMWVALNGEIYNFREIRKKLISKGHKFMTKSDTEIIVHAYEEYGCNCVKHFNGMFAFVIWDDGRKLLFGARDRVGIKPFFYSQRGDVLIFASEIKGILQDHTIKRDIDIVSLYNYLSRLFVQGPRTIYKGIFSLEPGHSFVFQRGKLSINKYWDLNIKSKKHLTEDQYIEHIQYLLEKSVKMQTVSDVPIGAFLSGGIDSNAVVAFLVKNMHQKCMTFSMGYTNNEPHLTNEIVFAKESAKYFNTIHNEITIQPENIISELPKIIWYFDQPYAGSLAQYHLSKLSSRYVKVVLSGLGGDELFGDYGRGACVSKNISKLATAFVVMPESIKQVVRALKNVLPDKIMWHIMKAIEIRSLYLKSDAVFDENSKKELIKEEVLDKLDIKDTFIELIGLFMKKSNARTIEDLFMYCDFKTQLPYEYFYYSDILSMSNSIETRVPFFDNDLIEFAGSIPFTMLIKNNDSKYLLKKAVKNILPPDITLRKKGYFSLPYGTWLRKELRSFVLKILSRKRIKELNIFIINKIEEIIEMQYQGDDTKTYQVWNLLMFMLWHEMFIERNAKNIHDAQKMQLI